jgi:DGQHR domain-containing protein
MINVAAIRMQQFGVHFYQASLTASDIDKLVRFEVLNYGESGQSGVRGGKKQSPSKVNWDLLERRIASSDKAYQRQIIRRKIDELVQYYEQCRQARDLPSIAGAVIISCDEKLTFEPVRVRCISRPVEGPEREGILRAIDGQHRLLALHADIENIRSEEFTVPAIIFDRLPEDHVVQMFVTINAKHTRLNASHLVSLSGRQLYRDEALAAAHDVVALSTIGRTRRSTTRSSCSAWVMAAWRRRRCAGAEEAVFERCVWWSEEDDRIPRRLEAVLRELLQAGIGRLRRGVERAEVQHQVSRSAARVHQGCSGCGAPTRSGTCDRGDFAPLAGPSRPWGRRIGDLRFETEGAWKRTGTTVDALARELKLALEYPEGAGCSRKPDGAPEGAPSRNADLAPPSIYGALP